MAISYSTLEAAAAQPTVEVAKTITEAKASRIKTAFLCHSHKDMTLVRGFVNYVKQKGWRVYIDWMDNSLPSKPDRRTAAAIKNRIEQTNLFIFLATENSMASRWCPWEIGYADGVKDLEKILIAETRDHSGNYHGNEYLGLYRKLGIARDGLFRAWEPGDRQNGILASTI